MTTITSGTVAWYTEKLLSMAEKDPASKAQALRGWLQAHFAPDDPMTSPDFETAIDLFNAHWDGTWGKL